ncbi:MAG: malto-oligosyltrehalose trehalohydrolase [Deltaproteobacteria bacterium]|nr:malto-oligosyltrehalose trehalohydrolase [Deltaproteobacteria bacterium]
MSLFQQPCIGAEYLGDNRCSFLVWAKNAAAMDLHIVGEAERIVPLQNAGDGYFRAEVENVRPGTLYFYRFDQTTERPDPASKFQPRGVHGPSQVIDRSFAWTDSHWFGLPLQRYIVYELHVGTYTAEGAFEAIIPHLAQLKELGVTALELMPVAQFPGDRNWGYDGAYPFAVQNSYGGPAGLKRLVDACHQQGLAVVLDVVYNHLGPEGNYFTEFGPYFTARYKTPWGLALNFDGPGSDPVRRFFIDNALYWISEFHLDALRLDATDQILDHSPTHFLAELSAEVDELRKELNRQVFLFPESAANDVRVIKSRELGGYNLDAQWNDEFHHALRAVLTEERTGYYRDFGEFRQLVKAYTEGFVYSGEYSKHRGRRHGSSTRDIPAERFIVFSQNHDQVGNRVLGRRLTQLVSFEKLKLAAGAVLLSPFVPLLFMGEEYGEEAPFQYFISHSDPQLIEAVRKGRQEEFAAFEWNIEPPDPQDEATFRRAKLNHLLSQGGHHRTLREFYRELIRLRKALTPLARLSKAHCEIISYDEQRVLLMRRWNRDQTNLILYNFSDAEVSLAPALPAGRWQKIFDSAAARWQGPGTRLREFLNAQEELSLTLSAASFALFQAAPAANPASDTQETSTR